MHGLPLKRVLRKRKYSLITSLNHRRPKQNTHKPVYSHGVRAKRRDRRDEYALDILARCLMFIGYGRHWLHSVQVHRY